MMNNGISIYLCFIALMLCAGCKREDKSILQKINHYHKIRSGYLNTPNGNEGKVLKDSLDLVWEQLVNERDQIIPFLLKFEHQEGTELYGSDYDSWPLQISVMPDSIHALYLIECLIQKDYLFNRRYRTLSSELNYFKNDGLNFLCDKNFIPMLTPFDFGRPFDNSPYHKFVPKAWELYKGHNGNWNESPLDSSSIIWFSLNASEKQVPFSPYKPADRFPGEK